MKIYLCVTNFKNDLVEAISKTTVELANLLAETEDCTLMIPGEITVRGAVAKNLKVVNYGIERNYHSKIRVLKQIYDIGVYFREHQDNPDIVHFVSGNLLELFLIRLLVPKIGKHQLITVWQPYLGFKESFSLWTGFAQNLNVIAHHYIFNAWLHIPFFIIGQGGFEKIIVHTQYQKSQLRYFPENKVVVIANGVNPPANLPAAQTNEIPRLLYLGHATGVKGVDVLIEALGKIKEEVNFSATFALSSFENVNLEKRINQLQLRKNITILGRADVYALMNSHDILILPHKTSIGTSCYPNTALEAFAVGLPIISSATAVLSELIEDGETGIHVPPNDVSGLANAIKHLSQTPSRRLIMANNQRQVYCEKYLFQTFVESLRSVYSTLHRV